MHTIQGKHELVKETKRVFLVSDKIKPICPFTILRAFLRGTGDLFEVTLISKINTICDDQDIKGYIELAASIDALTKNYELSTSVELVKGHRALCSLLKKFPFSSSETPYKPKEAAIEKWYAAEKQCAETNERLSNITTESLPT